MSKKISEKIKEIRNAENLTQEEFGEKVGVGKISVARYEAGTREPQFDVIKKVCETFPEYTMFLMLDEAHNLPNDQITPDEKKLRDLSSSEKTA